MRPVLRRRQRPPGVERDPRPGERRDAHVDQDRVEEQGLPREVHVGELGDHAETPLEVSRELGIRLREQRLSALSLPVEVVRKVDVAGCIRIAERHQVAVAIRGG